MRKLSHAFLVLPLVFALACQQQVGEETGTTAEPAADAAVETQALEDLMASYQAAYDAEDAAAIAAFYSEDAMWLPHDGPRVEGRAAIQAYIDERFQEMPDFQIRVETEGFDVASSGDMATGYGTYGFTGTGPDGEAVSVERQWVAAYHKIDGEWKLTGVMWNEGGPAADAGATDAALPSEDGTEDETTT